ncbi:MAG: M81 family metallopeptidase [Alphaproteobacteria bacterium]|jgi:microcystin degradation protein MlrC|nr:M81 family metallopeptidase [Alphaproteobacteria bacterium]
MPAEPPAAGPKIAILGLHLESNRFARPVARADFVEKVLFAGEAILEDARSEHPRQVGTGTGFIRAMDAAGDWQPAPLVIADAGAAGPIDHGFYLELKEEMRLGLEAATPLDGIYFAEHGAAVSTEISDPDGDLYRMARDIVGPGVPIVSTLDLHANVSDEMVELADVLVSYRTNPHVDQYERGVEAAGVMRELLSGVKPTVAFIRLPLVAPQVTQLTATGPYGEIIDEGQTRIDKVVMNVSILGGFTYGDTPENGMAFVVTTRDDMARARAVCRDLAARTWRQHERFKAHLTPLVECILMAVARGENPDQEPIIIADVADNPGGGGRGNTTWLLQGLVEAGAKGAILGVFNDAALAAEAHGLGEGATFEARFNRDEDDQYSNEFTAEATVLKLSDGQILGRDPGSRAGMSIDLGPTAALRVGTVEVVVISKRQQCIDPGYFEAFGIDVASARTVVVKSRGHFRAGFSVHFRPDQVIECDAPGLTSPNLANFEWTGFKRPIYPLDEDVEWSPPDW